MKIGVGQVTAAVHSKNITLLFCYCPPPPRNDHCGNTVGEGQEFRMMSKMACKGTVNLVKLYIVYIGDYGTRRNEQYLKKNEAFENDG